jgi:hypothetical protein
VSGDGLMRLECSWERTKDERHFCWPSQRFCLAEVEQSDGNVLSELEAGEDELRGFKEAEYMEAR